MDLRFSALLLTAALGASRSTDAAAQPHGVSPERERRRLIRRLVEIARPDVDQCERQAARRSKTGDVVFNLRQDRHRVVVDARKTRGLDSEALACVKRALGRALRSDAEIRDTVADLLDAGAVDVGEDDVPVGRTPAPALPPVATLLSKWKPVVDRHAASTASSRELKAILPADVTVQPDGCLWLPNTVNVGRARDAWLETLGKPLEPRWSPAFARLGTSFRVQSRLQRVWTSAYIVDAHSAVVVQRGDFQGFRLQPAPDFATSDDSICFVRATPARHAAIAAAFSQAGSCWLGDFDVSVRNPVRSFPTDRKYRAVSGGSKHACAIDESSAVVCCGVPVGPFGAATFHDVSGVDERTCALRTDGSAECHGAPANRTPPDTPPQPLTRVTALADATCGVTPQGQVRCWEYGEAPLSLPDLGRVEEISIATDKRCIRAETGKAACRWGSTAHRFDNATYKQIAAGGSICGLSNSGALACWTGGTALVRADLGHPQTQLALTDVGGCAADSDGFVTCWTMRDGRVVVDRALAPSTRVKRLSGSSSAICAIANDDSALCWTLDARTPVAPH
jgi:hypothetical protein